MKSYRFAAIACGMAAGLMSVAWAAGDPAAQLGFSGPVAAAMHGIDAERIRAHVRFLADDLLEGRGTGARGGDIAARYIATQFALDGLKPAGDNGTYLQAVNLTGVQTLPGTTASLEPAAGAPVDLKLGEDYVIGNQTATESVDVDAPIVFVGYGIEAPEYGWDDYKGVDVRGKVILVIVNEPPSTDPKFFNGEALTYYGRWTYKFEEAARKGALGALIIHRTDLAGYGWHVVRSSWSNEEGYLAGDREPKLAAASWIQWDTARRLFAASDLNLNLDEMVAVAGTRRFQARELPVRFKAHIESRVRQFKSYNVAGLVPGTQAGAAAQAVVFTAHYDHLGIDPSMSGHNIYNGAVDNATGCGILLELAHAFGASSARPPHPVLFVSVTAEEKGLLGSEHLGTHLPIPASQITLALNFDAIAPIGMPESVSVVGAQRTTFYPRVERTAAAFGLEIQPDPEPGAGHYYRSDHFSLARAGIPAFSIGTGIKFAGHPAEWGKAQRAEYTARRYHQPSDQYTPGMDFSTDAALARFGFALGWEALTAKRRVDWLPGDEFAAKRLQSMPH
jgi:Zn-dependent M28 family amino/carboxypeptidase